MLPRTEAAVVADAMIEAVTGVVPPQAYGGYKDVSEAGAAGELTVGDWPAAVGERPTGLKPGQHLCYTSAEIR